jgi:hypothetical protein
MEETSMQRIKMLSLFSLAVIGLGAALGWGLRHSSSFVGGGYEGTKLWIPPEALNMGTIWESDQFAWTVPIENHEAIPVEVESFGTTCNCLSIEPKSFVLQPGEQRRLALKINLTSQVKEGGQIAVGLWAKITKEDRRPGEPLGPEWKIAAQVRQVLKFNRASFIRWRALRVGPAVASPDCPYSGIDSPTISFSAMRHFGLYRRGARTSAGKA